MMIFDRKNAYLVFFHEKKNPHFIIGILNQIKSMDCMHDSDLCSLCYIHYENMHLQIEIYFCQY